MPTYDEKTALVVTDVQNDFADPDGNLYVSGGEKIVGTINREIDEAVRAGALVVYTQDWHPGTTPHFEKDGGVWPVHCVGGSWGSDLHPILRVVDDAPTIRKGTGGEDGYSAFTVRHPETGEERNTGLEGLLRDRGIERVVLVGLATDYCIKETALDASGAGFDITVLSDAVRAVEVNPGDGERALEEMRQAGTKVA
jgi:nicotinamidase/pyrazinamidase